MSSSAEGGGSRRRKQTAPKRVVRSSDEQEEEITNLSADASSSSSSAFQSAAQLQGHAVHESRDLDESNNYESDDGWNTSSLIEGREPRKKKAKPSGKSKADLRREEFAKKGNVFL